MWFTKRPVAIYSIVLHTLRCNLQPFKVNGRQTGRHCESYSCRNFRYVQIHLCSVPVTFTAQIIDRHGSKLPHDSEGVVVVVDFKCFTRFGPL
ncbi:hypothetical protein Mapa_004898 [Marchantia paleacea]|nr:hypothetical protein Mapa_004898 [Marchantia paleacea]